MQVSNHSMAVCEIYDPSPRWDGRADWLAVIEFFQIFSEPLYHGP